MFTMSRSLFFTLQVSYYIDVYSICPSKRSWLHIVNSDAPHHCWTTSLHPTPIVICVLYSNPWLTIMYLSPSSDLQPSVTSAPHRETQPIQLSGKILCLLLAICALCLYSNHQPSWSLVMQLRCRPRLLLCTLRCKCSPWSRFVFELQNIMNIR